jgi:hypothetical protein
MTDGSLVSVFPLFSHFSLGQSVGFHHFCQLKKKGLDKQKNRRMRDEEER